MRERIPCEFSLIRYVPDVVKGEFTNIGVILREAAGTATLPAPGTIRFTRDWTRVRCMHADADIALLEALEGELGARLALREARPILEVLEDTLANSLQISEPRACLAESLPAEMDQLMRLYVEPIRVSASARKRTGRPAIAAAMRTEFEHAGVWPLMRKRISAALYTAPGDPMKIDCGYRPNGVIRLFHAVSLEGDLEAAKVLAFTAPQLREGVARVEQATLELTAIVEAARAGHADPEADDINLQDARDAYRFGVDTLERQAIRVLTVADLPRIAATARTELRL